MNCKPGDLAVVVHDRWGVHDGRIVLCVSRNVELESRTGLPHWNVEPELRDPNGRGCIPSDSSLRPIRPGDISDEEVRDLYAPNVKETA